MRKLLLATIIAFAGSAAFGQYYVLPFTNAGTNPGGINNDVEQTSGILAAAPYNWNVALSGVTSPTWSPQQTVPFPFNFNGVQESFYKVSSTGVLTFDVASTAPAPAAANAALPNAAIPDKSVTIWGIDCHGANDAIVTKTFGSAPNRQHWCMFSSATYANVNWTYWAIVFEETSNSIYIVDMRTYSAGGGNVAVTAGIQIDATSTPIVISGSPALAALATNGGSADTPADNTYYEFKYGTQPQYDLTVNSVNLPSFALVGSSNQVTGSITNLGSQAITGFDLNYKVGTGATVTSTVTLAVPANGGSATFTHPTPWVAQFVGTQNVKVWATNLNGSNADADLSNDAMTVSVDVLTQTYPRMVFNEIFTSSTCPPCLPGNVNYHGVIANFPGEYVEVKYQQNFPGVGDPYCTTEAVDRRGYYAVNSIPRMEIDGLWDQNASSFTAAEHNAAKAVPAFVAIDASYSISGTTVNVDVDVDAVKAYNGVTLYVAINEKLTDNNVATNGETEFENVMKKMLPSDNGTSINLTSGTTSSTSLSHTFTGAYRLPADGQVASRINHATEHSVEEFTDLAVAVWVQDDATLEVLNAAWAKCALPSLATTVSPSLCSQTNGSVMVDTAGMGGMFSFNWSNNDTTSTITGIGAGAYTVTLTDLSGCSEARTYLVSDSSANPTITSTTAAATCAGATTGTATVNATGGTAPYTYAWSSSATTATATGLAAGNYFITVTDAAGCAAIDQVMVTESNAIFGNASATTPDCSDNGSIMLSAVGGNGTYTYAWDDGSTTATLSGKGAGSYTVTITDGNGCSTSESYTLTQNLPSAVVTGKSDESSVGNCDGSASVDFATANRATGYTWDAAANSQTTATATVLCAGTYSVTISDASGCTDVASVSIARGPGEPIGINEISDIALELYPNPASDKFTVTLPAEVNAGTITIVNQNGAEVVNEEFEATGSMEVETNKLAVGFYTVKLVSGGIEFQSKLSVIR